jgi:hypothetical protein
MDSVGMLKKLKIELGFPFETISSNSDLIQAQIHENKIKKENVFKKSDELFRKNTGFLLNPIDEKSMQDLINKYTNQENRIINTSESSWHAFKNIMAQAEEADQEEINFALNLEKDKFHEYVTTNPQEIKSRIQNLQYGILKNFEFKLLSGDETRKIIEFANLKLSEKSKMNQDINAFPSGSTRKNDNFSLF